MLSTERQPSVRLAAPKSEFLRNQRLEELARERQIAFQCEEAQNYWNRSPQGLVDFWNGIIPNVPACPFSGEQLLRFKKEATLPFFVPDNMKVEDLDRTFPEMYVKEATKANIVKDSGVSGWIDVKATIDSPHRSTSRLEMQEIVAGANKKDGQELIGGLGFTGYLFFAYLVERLTSHKQRIDSFDNDRSRLLLVTIGGFPSPLVWFDKGRLKTCSGLADTYKEVNIGWRVARKVSRDLTTG